MEKDLVKIIYKTIKKKSSVSELAYKLDISRNTLYSKFKKNSISLEFIIKIANIIRYDFKEEFPELRNYAEKNGLILISEKNRELLDPTKLKYVQLHKKYHMLLNFLNELSINYNFKGLQKKLKPFETILCKKK